MSFSQDRSEDTTPLHGELRPLREPSYSRTMILQQNSVIRLAVGYALLDRNEFNSSASLLTFRSALSTYACCVLGARTYPDSSPAWSLSPWRSQSFKSRFPITHEETRQCHQLWLQQLGVQVVNQLLV